MPGKKKPPPEPSTGFTLLAAEMRGLSNSLLPKTKTTPTTKGMAGNAMKALNSNFQKSLNAKGDGCATPTVAPMVPQLVAPMAPQLVSQSQSDISPVQPPVTATPSTTRSSRSMRSSRSSIASSRDTQSRDFPSPTVLYSMSDDDDNIDRSRHDLVVPISSLNRGMKRLQAHDIVKLRIGDEITVLIPPIDRSRKEPKPAREARETIMSKMKRVFMAECGTMSTKEKDDYWKDELANRKITRDGKYLYEFHVIISSYAERSMLEMIDLPKEYINYYMGNGNAGLAVKVRGRTRSVPMLLQFNSIPYIEIHICRSSSDSAASFLDDSIVFPSPLDEDGLSRYLQEQLHATKGDPVAYTEILMKYYQRALGISRSKLANEIQSNSKPSKKRKKDTAESLSAESEDDGLFGKFRDAIAKELHKNELEKFANEIDKEYEDALIGCVDFSPVTSFLIEPDRFAEFYNDFFERFPLCHYIFAMVVSTRYYTIPSLAQASLDDDMMDVQNADDDEDEELNEEEDKELHRKQRMILFLFLALIRTRSRHLLANWSTVEPLGHWFKGNQQPSRKSLAGGFTSTLQTCWKRQNAILKKYMPSFNEKLKCEPSMYGAFDNYNEVLQKINQPDGKAALTHIGTAYYAIQAKPIELPVGTSILSPHGISSTVTSCTRKSHSRYLICGNPTSSEVNATPGMIAESSLILTGLVWPALGWTVSSMPGFAKMPPLIYRRQEVPPPMRAWVRHDASDGDIVLDRSRAWKQPASEDAIPFTTNRMHEVSKQARRIIDMDSHVQYLKESRERAKAAVDAYEQSNVDANEPLPTLLEYDSRTIAFIEIIENASKEVDCAMKFETDIVRLINPGAGTVDKMFAWGITPYCETSHEGMKKTFTQLAQSFQLVDVSDDGRVSLLPNAEQRMVNFFGDGLSARNFSCLKYNITRQLTHLSNMEDVVALLVALRRCTMQMDYLHETRMHRQDCIWKSKYGSFLQAFQCHLGWKRIAGDPAKRNMQGHELFLLIIYRALRTHRFSCWLQSCCDDDFETNDDGTPRDGLVDIDEIYHAYCDGLETSEDEPSRLCAIFMKEVESYFRCVHSVKNSNFWMLEKEGCDWLGAYKVSGKSMYVPESLKRMELLYGDSLTDWEREEMRLNRLITLSAGGNAVAFDECNELLNLWDKGCVSCPNFGTVCAHSQNVMPAMKCSYETYGRKQRSPYIRHSSQLTATEKMVALFDKANIFKVYGSEKRTMTPNFFWNYVKRPLNVGSKKDKANEHPEITAAHRNLFQQLCTTEGHNQFEDFDLPSDEDDDDLVSVVSSCMGSLDGDGGLDVEDEEGPGEQEEDWERLNEKDKDARHSESLKHLGNVKKKCMSLNIMKDMLGFDGDHALKDIKKWREKKVAKERRKINMIFLAYIYFNKKMKERRKRLLDSLNKSKNGTFPRREYGWRDQFDAIMMTKRGV